MDLTDADLAALAPQLRKPEGRAGLDVAAVMAEKNRDVTAFTIDCLDLRPGDHVLEIGFGHGEGIAMALQQVKDGFVAGIDFSEDMVGMASQRNHRALMEERCELTLGEAAALPFPDESFHKVFAVNVFHFWPDALVEVRECLRVLKHGGRMAFLMAHPESYKQGLRDSGVFTIRSPEDVEEILRAVGCINVTHRSVTVGDFNGFAAIAGKKPQ